MASDHPEPSEPLKLGRFDPGQSLAEAASGFVIDPDIEEASAGHPARPTLAHAALVAAGGFIGTLARHLAASAAHLSPEQFPWTIVAINLSGAFALGLLGAALFDRRPQMVGLRLFLATGVLGGWTTYSAIVAGLLTQTHEHAMVVAGANLALSLVLPVAAALAGMLIGSRLGRRRESRA